MKMEDDLNNFFEKLEWRHQKNGRQPQNKIEDNLKKNEKNGRRPTQKWKTNQSTKINLIGCDTIVNSPSLSSLWLKQFAACGPSHFWLLMHHVFYSYQTLINHLQFKWKMYSVKNVIMKMLIIPQRETCKNCALLFLHIMNEWCLVLLVFSSSPTRATLTLALTTQTSWVNDLYL